MIKKTNLCIILFFFIISSNCMLLSQTMYKPEDFFKDNKVLELIKNVKSGDIKKAKELLNSGVNINAESDNFVTPLYYFFLKRDYPSFKRMLELGASPDVYPTGLGFFSLIDFSIDIMDDKYFKLLLEYNVNLEYERNQRNGDPPLLFSLYDIVNIKYLKMLIEHGININNNDGHWVSSPLFLALSRREYKKAILLLESGADFINNESIKKGFIKELESDTISQGKGTPKLKEQQQIVKYLKEKFNLDIKLYYPDGD